LRGRILTRDADWSGDAVDAHLGGIRAMGVAAIGGDAGICATITVFIDRGVARSAINHVGTLTTASGGCALPTAVLDDQLRSVIAVGWNHLAHDARVAIVAQPYAALFTAVEVEIDGGVALETRHGSTVLSFAGLRMHTRPAAVLNRDDLIVATIGRKGVAEKVGTVITGTGDTETSADGKARPFTLTLWWWQTDLGSVAVQPFAALVVAHAPRPVLDALWVATDHLAMGSTHAQDVFAGQIGHTLPAGLAWSQARRVLVRALGANELEGTALAVGAIRIDKARCFVVLALVDG